MCKYNINVLFLKYSDGATQQMAGCQRDFRNKPFPVRAKIEYYKNTLTVRIFIFFLLYYRKVFLMALC